MACDSCRHPQRRYPDHPDDCDCAICYEDRMDLAAHLYLNTPLGLREIADRVHMKKDTVDARLIRLGVKR